MSGALHLIKLCVGIDSVDHMADRLKFRLAQNRLSNLPMETGHVTRMWPKRSDELLDGGSLYWVIKGQVQLRQTILGLDEQIGQDGIRRCKIRLNPELMRTTPQPRRPFQGWRYLAGADAPNDLGLYREGEDTMPAEMQSHLAALGVI